MKKLMCVFLILCVFVSIVGCQRNDPPKPTDPTAPTQTAPPTQPTTEPTTEPTTGPTTEPVTEPSSEPSTEPTSVQDLEGPDPSVICSVTLIQHNDEYWYDDGTVLVLTSAPDAQATAVNDNASWYVSHYLSNTISASLYDPIAILDQANADYESGRRTGFPYKSYVDVNCVRLDQRVMSLRGAYYWFSGGAHPSFGSIGMNYDMRTGEKLTLDQLFLNQAASDLVKAMVLDTLEKKSKKLYKEYAEAARLRFTAETQESSCYYFTDDGITIFFPPDEIAPFSQGEINVTVSYEDLEDCMKPEYFPLHPADSSGSVVIKDMDKLKDTPLTVVDVTDYGIGGNMALIADGDVTDFRIERCPNLAQDKPDPNTAFTVFACDHLNDGQIVNLKADIPDTIPNLRITYRSNGKTVTRYISQSGKDGSYLLLKSYS